MRKLKLILLCVGMALAVSCSKDNLNDYEGLPTQTVESEYVTPFGTFEGEWQLSKYGKTCLGEIEVDADKIVFDIPADYLLPRLGFVSETSKAAYPDEPFYTTTSDYTYSNTSQVMQYSTLGYSSTAIYIQNESIVNESIPKEENGVSFGVKADDVDYNICLVGIKEQPTAVFDRSSNLWKLAIPIDKATIYNRKTGVQRSIAILDEDAPDKSAWLFVFRAQRRIK